MLSVAHVKERKSSRNPRLPLPPQILHKKQCFLVNQSLYSLLFTMPYERYLNLRFEVPLKLTHVPPACFFIGFGGFPRLFVGFWYEILTQNYDHGNNTRLIYFLLNKSPTAGF